MRECGREGKRVSEGDRQEEREAVVPVKDIDKVDQTRGLVSEPLPTKSVVYVRNIT